MKGCSVLVVMGSLSDLPVLKDARDLLDRFRVSYEIKVLSAHRSPKLLTDQLENLSSQTQVIIAAAGGAAHLAGVIASHTLRPIIAVPMPSKLDGVDSFVSTSQMPAGIPVATMSIGKAGATNAALFAVEILALKNPELEKKLIAHRKSMIKNIRLANQELKKSRGGQRA